MITTEEAIKHLELYVGNNCYTTKMQTVCKMAISALRAQQERENSKPLTLDELREMDGEPVYLSDLVEKDGVWEGWIVFTSYNEYGFRPRGGGLFPIDGYGKTWLVYRHKPEGGANTNA